jgi:hypothetical protein
MTATLFNIHQMRNCLRETLSMGEGISAPDDLEKIKRDAYYVLSCLGQFHLPESENSEFLKTLTYGLFRPMVSMDRPEPAEGHAQAKLYTKELLQGKKPVPATQPFHTKPCHHRDGVPLANAPSPRRLPGFPQYFSFLCRLHRLSRRRICNGRKPYYSARYGVWHPSQLAAAPRSLCYH